MAANYEYDEAAGHYDDQAAALRQQEVGYDPNFVPDSVKSFVVHLYRHIREKNVYEIHQMYETSFQTLSERLFKDTPWPSVDAVAHYVDNDHVFCLLYREMWFRHLYARLSPTLKQRIDSWDNYCSLFQVVLHGVVNMQLPNQWLWDMVDEFVYQFQSFCQYRAKMKNKTEQEIALLRQFDQAWNVYGVLNFLQALVEKSAIIHILEQEKEGLEQFTATDGYDYSGGSNVLKVLGYFSMIGLLRVHCLLGDYHTGLKCLQPIDISQQGVYTSVIGSHIATIYHYGFASLMLRRYVDGIREFNKILLYIYKTKQYHQKSPQYEQILKKNEQMYALLAICLSFCPQMKLVDEAVNAQLREKYGEKMGKLQRYDDEAYGDKMNRRQRFADEAFGIYDELFSYACPKFITPSAPSFDEPLVNYNQDAYRLQLKLFLSEVRQQELLVGARTFLKVYSTISLGKLANYLDVDESTLRMILMTYKHKTHAVDSAGKIISNADVDFYIDDDMVRVVDSKPVKRYGDFFLRQIVKLEGVINDVDRIKVMVAYRDDPSPSKLNLGIGVYRTEEGKPHLLNVVSKAEKLLLNDKSVSKEYLPITGLSEFNQLSARLVLGHDSFAIKEKRVCTVQCLSGSGSLRIGAELLARFHHQHVVYLSQPTYGNHMNFFIAAGITVKYYRYYDEATKGLDFQGLLEDLGSAESGAIVLLQASSHNPTGVDPTVEQWEQIRQLIRQRGLVPFFDCAYQVCKAEDVACRVESQLKLIIRPMYSNPPIHGAAIVATILRDREMYDAWTAELKAMIVRIVNLRHQLYDALCERGTPGDWKHIVNQVGMFTFSGLNEDQVSFLTKHYHIYMSSDGRINMAGLSSKTVPYLANAIHEALASVP
ncbi:unnamed protein product [Linum tenue]|uniref:Eukaryotic translation initiation factor 3 subunit L n=1 Tax=Linum tenue TaxID=586396 RepID=A0AAV0JF24_9ROSI|nr:unnamed protein product [Linum tenue]